MGKMNFTLPTGEDIPLIYGAIHPENGGGYLYAVRAGYPVSDFVEGEYRAMLPTRSRMLAQAVRAELPNIDAIASPPSSRPDAEPFRSAIKSDGLEIDFTNNFSRRGEVKISDNATTMDQAIHELIYEGDGQEKDVCSLVIVDESLGLGKTIAAMLHHLRAAGLPFDCRILAAVWVKST